MNLLTLITDASSIPDSGLAGLVADVMGSVGLFGVGLILAVETIFPFLPSEVALPLAGFSAERGDFGLVAVIIAATIGSVVGALFLYWVSLKFGLERTRAVLSKVPFVTEKDIDKGVAWFARNDAAAVFLGRMVPGVRSLISVPAGVEKMPLVRFLVFTTAGSLIWNVIWIVAGYQLGNNWESVEQYASLLKYVLVVAVAGLLVWFAAYKFRARNTPAA